MKYSRLLQVRISKEFADSIAQIARSKRVNESEFVRSAFKKIIENHRRHKADYAASIKPKKS